MPPYTYRNPLRPRRNGDKLGNEIAASIQARRYGLVWELNLKCQDIACDSDGVEWKIVRNEFKAETYLHRNGEFYCDLPNVKRFWGLSWRHKTAYNRVVAELVIAGRLKGGGRD